MKIIPISLLMCLFALSPLPKEAIYVTTTEILKNILASPTETKPIWLVLPLADSAQYEILSDMGKEAPPTFEEYRTLILNSGWRILHLEIHREPLKNLPHEWASLPGLTPSEQDEFNLRFQTSTHIAKQMLAQIEKSSPNYCIHSQ